MAGKNPEAICIMDLDDSSSINKSSCSSSLASIAALPTAAKQMSTTNSTTLPPAINEVAHFLNDSDDDEGESMQIQLMPAALLAASGTSISSMSRRSAAAERVPGIMRACDRQPSFLKLNQFNREAGQSLFQNLFRECAEVISPLATPTDGYMYKQSRRGNWQQRWFTFRSPSMVYWKHRPVQTMEESPDTLIDLRRVRSVTTDNLVMALTFSTRTYNIKAMDREQLKVWTAVIRRTIQEATAAKNRESKNGRKSIISRPEQSKRSRNWSKDNPSSVGGLRQAVIKPTKPTRVTNSTLQPGDRGALLTTAVFGGKKDNFTLGPWGSTALTPPSKLTIEGEDGEGATIYEAMATVQAYARAKLEKGIITPEAYKMIIEQNKALLEATFQRGVNMPHIDSMLDGGKEPPHETYKKNVRSTDNTESVASFLNDSDEDGELKDDAQGGRLSGLSIFERELLPSSSLKSTSGSIAEPTGENLSWKSKTNNEAVAELKTSSVNAESCRNEHAYIVDNTFGSVGYKSKDVGDRDDDDDGSNNSNSSDDGADGEDEGEAEDFLAHGSDHREGAGAMSGSGRSNSSSSQSISPGMSSTVIPRKRDRSAARVNVPSEFASNEQLYYALSLVRGLRFTMLPLDMQRAMVNSVTLRSCSPRDGSIVKQRDWDDASFYIVVGPYEDSEVVVITHPDEGGVFTTNDKAITTENKSKEESKEREIMHLGVGACFNGRSIIDPFNYSTTMPHASTVRPRGDQPVSVAKVELADFHLWQPLRLALIMAKIPLLQKLPESSRNVLQERLHFARYAPGEIVFQEGGARGRFYMLARGEVQVTDQGYGPVPPNPPRVLANLSEDSCFVESSIVLDSPSCNATVQVIGNATVEAYFLEREDVQSCMHNSEFQSIVNELMLNQEIMLEKRDAQVERELRILPAHSLIPDDETNDGSIEVSSQGQRTKRGSNASFPESHRPMNRNQSGYNEGVVRSVNKRRSSDGDVWVNEFKRVGRLGKGSYGEVFKVEDSCNRQCYALKVLDSKKSSALSIQREIAVLQRLKHANLVKLYEVLDDPKDSKVYLIMELVERGQLIGDVMSVKPFSDATARRYFRDVLCGLAYLHVHGVVHCDLKPQNLFVTADDRIKIADFGSATFAEVTGSQEASKSEIDNDALQINATDLIDDGGVIGISRAQSLTTKRLEHCEAEETNHHNKINGGSGQPIDIGPSSESSEPMKRLKPRKGQSVAAAPGDPSAPAVAEVGNMAAQAALGTPLFMAPELFNCSSSQYKINGPQFVQPSVDIWSLGATLFMMVCGKPPWVGRNELELSHRIQHLELAFPNHGFLSCHLRNVIQKMLVKEPIDRVEMYELFKDAWVTQEGSDPIELNVEDFAGVLSTGVDKDNEHGLGNGDEFKWQDDGEFSNSSDGIIDNDESEEEGGEKDLNRDFSRQGRSRSKSSQRGGKAGRRSGLSLSPARKHKQEQLHIHERAAALVDSQGMLPSPSNDKEVAVAQAEAVTDLNSTTPFIADSAPLVSSNAKSASSRGTSSSRDGTIDASFEVKRELRRSTINFTSIEGSTEVMEDSDCGSKYITDKDVHADGKDNGYVNASSGIHSSGNMYLANGNSHRFQARGLLRRAPRDGLSSLRFNSDNSTVDSSSKNKFKNPEIFQDLLETGSGSDDSNNDEDYDVSGQNNISNSKSCSDTKGGDHQSISDDVMAFLDYAIRESETHNASCADINNRNSTGDGTDLREHVALLNSGPEQFQPLEPSNDPWLQNQDESGVVGQSGESFSFDLGETSSLYGGIRTTSGTGNRSNSHAGHQHAARPFVNAAKMRSSRKPTYPRATTPPRVASTLHKQKPPPLPPQRQNSLPTTTKNQPATRASSDRVPPSPQSLEDQASLNGTLTLKVNAKVTTVAGCKNNPIAVSPVQVRNWGTQSNLATTFVRFGFHAAQGPCKYMEDRIMCLPTWPLPPPALPQPPLNDGPSTSNIPLDAAGSLAPEVRIKSPFTSSIAVMPSSAEITASTLAGSLLLSGSCFAVYDGHGGSESADYLKEHLHAAIARRLADAHRSTVVPFNTPTAAAASCTPSVIIPVTSTGSSSSSTTTASITSPPCGNGDNSSLNSSSTRRELQISASRVGTRLQSRRNTAATDLTSKVQNFDSKVKINKSSIKSSSSSSSNSSNSSGKSCSSSRSSSSTNSSGNRVSRTPPSQHARRSPLPPPRISKASSSSVLAATEEVKEKLSLLVSDSTTPGAIGTTTASTAIAEGSEGHSTVVTPEAWHPVEQAISQAFLEVDVAVVLAERQRLASAKKQLQGNGLSHPSRSTGSTALVLLLFRAPASSSHALDTIATTSDSPRAVSRTVGLKDGARNVLVSNTPPQQAVPTKHGRTSLASGSSFRGLLRADSKSSIKRQTKSPRYCRDNGSISSETKAGSSGSSSSSSVGVTGNNGSDNSGGALWLVAANVGDCRAVLSRNGQAVPLSFDHKATSPRERARIDQLGLSAQVRDGRLFGVLAVSRSFGDSALKARQSRARAENQEQRQAELESACASAPPPVDTPIAATPPQQIDDTSSKLSGESQQEALVALPEVTKTQVQASDEFVVVASDGVWDVLGSQQALNFVRRRLGAHKCAQRAAGELVAEALAQGSHDNTSALVVMLHQVPSQAI